MKCSKWRIMISAAADSEIPEVDLTALSAHLQVCPDCRAAAETLEVVRRRLASGSGRFSPSAFFNTRLAAAIDAEEARRGVLPFWRRLSRSAVYGFVSASAVAALLYVALPLFQGGADDVTVDTAVVYGSSTVALLSDPEEDERFDSDIVDIYYGVAYYDPVLVDENNNVSLNRGDEEVV